MLEKNKVYRARIQGYTSEGLGVARIDGQAVFVHQALRGEECDILVLKVLKNAAFGKAVRVYEPSPHRVEPDCPYYGRCGGCDFRHMDRAEELAAKRQRVQDALARIGGSAVTVEGIDGGEPLHYRNKSQYPVAADGSVGFYKARSHQVIPVERCRIQKPQADAAAQALRTYLRLYGVSCYDEKTRRGLVRYLYVRTNGAGQSLLCVLVNGKKLPHERELVDLLRQAVPETVGVVLGVNTRPTGAVLGQEYRTLWGADVLTDTLCGLTFRLSVPSFYQVNREMAEVLYRRAVEFAGLTGTETVLDLYCGAGTITQVMARHAGRVIGAEIVPEAIEDARANAQRNGVENVEFFCGDAAAAAADCALIVCNSEPVCIRDASIVRRLLTELEVPQQRLVINRFNAEYFGSLSAGREDAGGLRDLDDVIDQSGVRLIGIVPEDRQMTAAFQRGCVPEDDLPGMTALSRIAARMNGVSVPLSL